MAATLGQDDRLQKARLAVDARLGGEGGTGVASYARALAAAVATRGLPAMRVEDDSVGRFGVAQSPAERARRLLAAYRPGVRALDLRDNGATLWRADLFRLAHVRFGRTGRLLRLRAPGPPGLVHWSYPVPIRIDGWANVYTVHDAIPLSHPALSPIHGPRWAAQVRAVAAGGTVATVSDHARRAIEAALPELAGRVTDCGSAVVGLQPAGQALPANLEPGGFMLFCGLVEERKNLARLLKSWTRAGRPLPLVVAGPDGAEGPGLRAELARGGATVLPFQPRGRLVDLMVAARALAFPTLEEGFGLPVAEAMALGTPVLTAAGGAAAEVAGGAALLVDPLDEDAMARAIVRLARDDGLVVDLVARGCRRAREWTPDRFAARLFPLYARLLAEGQALP